MEGRGIGSMETPNEASRDGSPLGFLWRPRPNLVSPPPVMSASRYEQLGFVASFQRSTLHAPPLLRCCPLRPARLYVVPRLCDVAREAIYPLLPAPEGLSLNSNELPFVDYHGRAHQHNSYTIPSQQRARLPPVTLGAQDIPASTFRYN